jgi:hypothetical protein
MLEETSYAKYSGGDGSAEDPFQIATPNDLNDISDDPCDWDKDFILTSDINMADYIYSTALIAPDINGGTWEYQGTFFTGVFDGNDCNISNFTIDTQSTGYDFIGLFGQIGASSQIINLGLVDVNITAFNGSLFVAGLCGRNGKIHGPGGIINNCYVTGSLSGNSVSGLCSTNYGMLSDCYVNATLNGTGGGLCGTNDMGTIMDCYATGSIMGGGGLCWINRRGSIYRCYASTSIISEDFDNMGGLCGRLFEGYIVNCYATGSVIGGSSSNYVGGFCGKNEKGSITSCYSISSVTGYDYVGGFCGKNDNGSISNCYNTGSVSASGPFYIGGFLGYNSGSTNYCYFLDPNDGGGPNNGYGTPLTDLQMKQQSSFTGWDFINESVNGTNQIWQIPTDSYPVLSSFNGHIPPVLTGSGSEHDPWLVHDQNELGAIFHYGPSGYYKIKSDINLEEITWSVPVIPDFFGYFDGNGFEIQNITINGGGFLGFFGRIASDGQVTNLRLENVNVISGYNSDNIGGLCGFNRGTISSCFCSGSISGGERSYSVGGLCGKNNSGSISECYMTGSVSGDRIIGGLCGTNESQVSRCHASSSVAGIEDSSHIGGLCGWNWDGMINNCYSFGSINGGPDSDRVGGLCGYNDGTINKSYSSSSVSGDLKVGGFCGFEDYGGTSIDCYFLDPNDGGGPNNGIGTLLTDSQMKQKNSFVGWDFINTWDLTCEGISYPRLIWQIIQADYLCPHGIDFIDYAFFANHYGLSDCNDTNDCNSTDLDFSGNVGPNDFDIFTTYWLFGK